MNGKSQDYGFDPNFTANVISATGPNASPRARKLAGGLMQHLHDFMRENMVTMDELLAAVDLINWAGRISSPKRNEGLLLADILGLESLADSITHTLATANSASPPTVSAILGPFYRASAPVRAMGSSLLLSPLPGAETVFYHGAVRDCESGLPLANATLDVWLAAPNGMYEGQDEMQPEGNLRGKFITGEDGRYAFYAVRPTAYQIPEDGPAGEVLRALDRHSWRPAHVHFMVSAPGYKSLITQIYDGVDEYCSGDAVFNVRDSLVANFVSRDGDPQADLELAFDFKLALARIK